MTRRALQSLFQSALDPTPSQPQALSLMTSVIGNIFKLTKGNVTHATSIDDWVVVLGYAANVAKGGRMEAEIGVFQIEGEAIAAAATAKALALAPADAGAIAAHTAAMAKVKGSVLQGLSHMAQCRRFSQSGGRCWES